MGYLAGHRLKHRRGPRIRLGLTTPYEPSPHSGKFEGGHEAEPVRKRDQVLRVESALRFAYDAALLAVVYNRRQTLAIENQGHADHEPEIDLTVETDKGSPAVSGVLVVAHRRGPPLESMDVEISVPAAPPHEVPVPTFGPGNHGRVASLRGLQPGDSPRLTIVLNPSPPKRAAEFRLTCRPAKGKPWVLSRTVEGSWMQPKARVINLNDIPDG